MDRVAGMANDTQASKSFCWRFGRADALLHIILVAFVGYVISLNITLQLQNVSQQLLEQRVATLEHRLVTTLDQLNTITMYKDTVVHHHFLSTQLVQVMTHKVEALDQLSRNLQANFTAMVHDTRLHLHKSALVMDKIESTIQQNGLLNINTPLNGRRQFGDSGMYVCTGMSVAVQTDFYPVRAMLDDALVAHWSHYPFSDIWGQYVPGRDPTMPCFSISGRNQENSAMCSMFIYLNSTNVFQYQYLFGRGSSSPAWLNLDTVCAPIVLSIHNT